MAEQNTKFKMARVIVGKSKKAGQFEVEKILDVREVDGKDEFFIKWKGFDE